MTPLVLTAFLTLSQPPTPPAEQIAKIVADLKEARTLLPKVSDKATRERLELLITRSELAAGDLQKALAARPVAKPVAVSDANFAELMKSLNNNAFDNGKLSFVKTLGTSKRFTSAQAKQIMAAFSFDADRVSAGVILHGLVVDPELFNIAIDTCTFESNKRELRAKIGMK
jgi:hypothetical protein